MPKPAKNAEYEVIEHSVIRSFKLSLVEVLHRAPHIHGELEIGFLLEGEAEAICDGKRLRLTAPDFYIANPFSLHETRAEKPVVFLSLQVLASFFREHYPEMGSVHFEFTSGKAALQHPQQAYFQRVYDFVLSIARHYFMGETGFSLYCAGKMNHLFYDLIKLHPYTTVSEVWQDTARLGRIDSYIQEHYDKKLLLAEVAQREGLSLSYLSHYFREHWGEPFQAHLLRLRCEKARQLLMLTDLNLLDICMECGISDMKYLNRGFSIFYGVSPKELRRTDIRLPPRDQTLPHTRQRFFTPGEALAFLDKVVL